MTYDKLIATLQSASLYLQDMNLEPEVDAVSFAEEYLRANPEDAQAALLQLEEMPLEPL